MRNYKKRKWRYIVFSFLNGTPDNVVSKSSTIDGAIKFIGKHRKMFSLLGADLCIADNAENEETEL